MTEIGGFIVGFVTSKSMDADLVNMGARAPFMNSKFKKNARKKIKKSEFIFFIYIVNRYTRI